MHHRTVSSNCGHHREVAARHAAYRMYTRTRGATAHGHTTPPARGRLVSFNDVADERGVDVRHVRRLVDEKRIPYIRWGHLPRFGPAEIATWIDRHRNHPSAR
jgi:hypothetical protein